MKLVETHIFIFIWKYRRKREREMERRGREKRNEKREERKKEMKDQKRKRRLNRVQIVLWLTWDLMPAKMNEWIQPLSLSLSSSISLSFSECILICLSPTIKWNSCYLFSFIIMIFEERRKRNGFLLLPFNWTALEQGMILPTPLTLSHTVSRWFTSLSSSSSEKHFISSSFLSFLFPPPQFYYYHHQTTSVSLLRNFTNFLPLSLFLLIWL